MQAQFANVGNAEISLRSGLSAYLICTTIAFTKAIPKENASAKRKTRFPVEIVKIVFSPLSLSQASCNTSCDRHPDSQNRQLIRAFFQLVAQDIVNLAPIQDELHGVFFRSDFERLCHLLTSSHHAGFCCCSFTICVVQSNGKEVNNMDLEKIRRESVEKIAQKFPNDAQGRLIKVIIESASLVTKDMLTSVLQSLDEEHHSDS